MGHYVYNPNKQINAKHFSEVGRKSEIATTPEEYILSNEFNSPRYIIEEKDLPTCLDRFFSHPHIEGLVKQNAWDEIFNCWEKDYKNLNYGDSTKYYGNKPGWDLSVLCIFLALCKVDFWKYITARRPWMETDLPVDWVEG